MCDPSKNKMADVNSRFASVSKLDLILRTQEDAVPENTKKAMKFGLWKFSKDWKDLPTFN